MHRYLIDDQPQVIRGWRKTRDHARTLAASKGRAVPIHEVKRREPWPVYVGVVQPDGTLVREHHTRTTPRGFGL